MRREFRLGIPAPLAAAAGFAGLVLWPQAAAQAAGAAISLCLTRLLPALFPYFVLSGLILRMGWLRGPETMLAPMMRRFFALPGACAGPLLLGLLGGYPVGARSAMALYAAGGCTKHDAERLLMFCNNSGPAFLFGAVGAGLFGDVRAGFVFFAVHALAAVSVGLLSRLLSRSPGKEASMPPVPSGLPPRFFAVFSDAVTQAVQASAAICGFVLFFAVLSALLTACGLLPLLTGFVSEAFRLPPETVRACLVGSLELTAGLDALRTGAGSPGMRMCLAAFLLGWGGFSVHGQVLALKTDETLSLRPYLFGKLMHGILSAAYMYLFLVVSGFSLPAFQSAGTPGSAISPSLIPLVLLFLAVICFFFRNRVY